MKLESFVEKDFFVKATELERIELLAYYHDEIMDQRDFSVNEFCNLFVEYGLSKPNASRLIQKIKKSRSIVKGSAEDTFRLSIVRKKELVEKIGRLDKSEEIDSDDSILPEALFEKAGRSYLQKLTQQINASYENNLFDGAAMIMRRLLEILIIHSFEAVGKMAEITDADGNYKNLKSLINAIKDSSEISLSKASRKSIDRFRELGNLSAHKIHYNCRRDDIRKLQLEYRALVEELLYKAKLIK